MHSTVKKKDLGGGTFPFYGPSEIPLGAHRDLDGWALALARPPTTFLWCCIPEPRVPTTASGARTLRRLNVRITTSYAQPVMAQVENVAHDPRPRASAVDSRLSSSGVGLSMACMWACGGGPADGAGGCATQLHSSTQGPASCWPVVGLIEGGSAHPGASIYGEPEPWCWPGILPGGRLASIPPSSRRPSGSIPACAGEPSLP